MNDPILYLLVRNDIASLNPGKGMAQASHATNLLTSHIFGVPVVFPKVKEMLIAALNETESDTMIESFKKIMDLPVFKADNPYIDWYNEWEGGRGFGTTITLAVTVNELLTVCTTMARLGFPAKIVLDSTYPLKDGATTHSIPLVTCGFVFGPKLQLEPYLKNFPLYP